ncbi:MAG: radical SAM protein [Clostridiales bacterium]|nr:radical SAM protein [Clostridiales bacterium]
MVQEPFKPDDVVKTCCKLESGLNLSIKGLRACTRGALMPPIFCTPDEINSGTVTKEFIIEKRKNYIRMLNDNISEMDCKSCLMIEEKRYGDISFNRLGHIDLQHYSYCNLRCVYCNYNREYQYVLPQYDALAVLKLFSSEEVEWNSHVDFAGGEPTLLDDISEYLEFFRNRRIRVMMYTNGIIFNEAIYSGLADGSIYSVICSVDAGIASTYLKIRGRDSYLQVIENLTRYAAAGSNGKGFLAVKYIFTDSNYDNDNVAGFAYAMLAIRPQQVWLTFDFSPLFLQQWDYDYSKLIDGYARLYLLLKKHGFEAFHYYREAVASVSRQGREMMDRVFQTLQEYEASVAIGDPDLQLSDFRDRQRREVLEPAVFSLRPLKIRDGNTTTEWSLLGKRILLVPSSPQTQKLLEEPEIASASWIGFIDRNPVQQGKSICGRIIYSYDDIPELQVDVVLVVPPEKHRRDILAVLAATVPEGVRLAELKV